MLKKFFMTSLFCILHSLQAFSTVVYIWEPDGKENKYGHVAIGTKSYHMSFWPSDGNKGGIIDVPAQLHYNVSYDALREGNIESKFREPIRYPLESISPSKLNTAYEEFLEYNDVTPDRVTIDVGKEMFEKKGEEPTYKLSRTKYNAVTSYLFPGTEFNRDYFKESLACTSFAMNLLEQDGGKISAAVMFAKLPILPIEKITTTNLKLLLNTNTKDRVYVNDFHKAIKCFSEYSDDSTGLVAKILIEEYEEKKDKDKCSIF